MPAPWRIAESLKKLREQIDEAYPNRDKTSDGGIGDAGHATRTSDHNPWVKDSKGQGVVTAIDIDEDLSPSIHTLKGIVDAICASKDPRVKYIIYEGRITVGGTDLQMWKRYTGPNSHSHHAHISVVATERLYDSRDDWSISAREILPAPAITDKVEHIVIKGDTLWGLSRKYATAVEEIRRLNGLKTDTLQIGQRLRVR
jgi:nucleoid-associated protein YgaU